MRPVLTLPLRGTFCEQQHSYAGQVSPFNVPMGSPTSGPMPTLPAGSTCTPSNAASTYWRTATCPNAPSRLPRRILTIATNSDSTPRSRSEMSTPTSLVCPANLWPSNCATPVNASPWPQALGTGPMPGDLFRMVSGQSGTVSTVLPQPGTCSFPGPETRHSTIADVSMESSGPATPSPTRGSSARAEPASISPITPPGKQDRVRHQTSGEKLAFPMS